MSDPKLELELAISALLKVLLLDRRTCELAHAEMPVTDSDWRLARRRELVRLLSTRS